MYISTQIHLLFGAQAFKNKCVLPLTPTSAVQKYRLQSPTDLAIEAQIGEAQPSMI